MKICSELLSSSEPKYEFKPKHSDGWPSKLSKEAFIGPAGRFVDLCLPHTEADEANLLFHFLTVAGNIFSRNAYYAVSSARLQTNLFCFLVGISAVKTFSFYPFFTIPYFYVFICAWIFLSIVQHTIVNVASIVHCMYIFTYRTIFFCYFTHQCCFYIYIE